MQKLITVTVVNPDGIEDYGKKHPAGTQLQLSPSRIACLGDWVKRVDDSFVEKPAGVVPAADASPAADS